MKTVIHDRREALHVLKKLDSRLRKLCDGPPRITWKFPNGGGRYELPTWSLPIKKGRYLVIGFKPEFRWSSRSGHLRCPLLLSIEEKEAWDGMTSLVEINIPQSRRRNVNGCFVRDERTAGWLCHRGVKLTVHGSQKIPKKRIMRHFKKWLVKVRDGEKYSEVIRVVGVDVGREGFRTRLVRFVEEVDALKRVS